MAKQMAKAAKPRIASKSSSKVCGTSSETTSKVTAKAKTASLNPSSRVISPARQRKFSSHPNCFSCAASRSILTSVGKRFLHRFALGVTPKTPFPARHPHSGQAIADDIQRSPPHVHELVHRQDDEGRLAGQPELRRRAQEDH